MVEYLGFNENRLRDINGYNTANEIVRQPLLWKKIYKEISIRKNEILAFFHGIKGVDKCNVILTGAGSSAYIGEVLESAFIKNISRYSRAVATTTIVTHPEIYFTNDRPTIMVSFARSGNSPESVASISMANEMCENVFHIVITCNPSGKMIEEMDLEKDYLLLLPEESNDIGLAMTGSFTGMLLAGYLISRLADLEILETEINLIAEYGANVIQDNLGRLKDLSNLDFNRVVFLGSGPLLGIAREAHLKVQELTNGVVMCNYDSYLGLRHGPKVVVGPKTIVVFLISNDQYVQQYEKDLISDMVNESLGLRKLSFSENKEPELDIDFQIYLSNENRQLDPYLYSMVSILPAQVLGFLKSVQLGCSPDSPSENGAISRVVRGVKLYNYQNQVRVVGNDYKIN
ncbi:SIS domain-containing protein [Membranihabitans maritimus]|uniref:SIS domain-containing protein n=1 Tax=Membranihabitans maritimus TaxID=2904244 RepID=UPI001F0295D3|nr:SIS domain-containing protein [Membranihabitans maritimus]